MSLEISPWRLPPFPLPALEDGLGAPGEEPQPRCSQSVLTALTSDHTNTSPKHTVSLTLYVNREKKKKKKNLQKEQQRERKHWQITFGHSLILF